jgi:hypothetical protein
MAIVLEIDFTARWGAALTEISLTDGTEGFRLLDWVQGTPNGTGRVIETITLSVEGTSHDDLASNLQLLDEAIYLVKQRAGNYPAESRIVLKAKLDNETLARSAYIHDMERSFASNLNKPPTSPGNYIQEFILTVERDDMWEQDITTNLPFSVNTSSLSIAGGIWNYSAEAEGDTPGEAPARIERTLLEYVSGSASGTASEFWWGFKSARYGLAVGNFISTWECEDGTNGTDTTDVADANASSNTAARCTFATNEDKATRLTVTLDDVASPNEDDQRGTYTILLRAKTTDTREADVWLRDGIKGWGGFREHPRVRVSNTSDYMLHSVGTVMIPSFGMASLGAGSINSILQYYALSLDAASVTGSGNLDMDCFYLIPADEGAAYVSGGSVGTAGDDLIVTTEHDWQHYVFNYRNTLVAADTPPSLSTINYTLPPEPSGGARMVLCAQTATAHRLSDVLEVTIDYSSRWPTLRGAADT